MKNPSIDQSHTTMTMQFSSLVSSQIRFLLQSLNDSNSDSVFHELCQFVEYGSEASILLLQTCLDHMHFFDKLDHMNFHGGDMHNMQPKPDFLAAIFRYLLVRPNFSTVFCEALRSLLMTEAFLGEFCSALYLSVYEKIGLGLALADSEILDIRTTGQNFCMAQIEELYGNPTSIDSSEQVQYIILFLYRSEGLAKHVDSFMQMLSLMEPKEMTPFILAPLLSDDLCQARLSRNLDLFYGCSENEFDVILAEIESETSMADIMRELGYGCTLNATHCKEVLSLFSPLTEMTISRILGTIARTHTGLEDNQNSYSTFCSAIGSSATSDSSCLKSWNVDILVDSMKQLAPGTNWILVMENLDHEGFYFPNDDAFSFFMSIYARACQDPFPLHAICGSVWKHVDGQLSFLRYAVSAPAEIFTFSHSNRKLAYTDVLNAHELPHGLANHAWLSLDVLEVLCQLAERGHVGSVRPMLEFPLKHCPEILLLGIAQIDTAYNLLQCEVSSTIFPIIVGNATGIDMIRQLWHSNPKLVLRGLIDLIKADQGNIVRILDICQELKILSSVLEQIPFSFSIRLAAFASQKEYIILQKWLDDNLSTYKDVFFEECLKFLKELPFVATDDVSANPFQHSGALVNLYEETSATFLEALHANSEKISSDQLSELKKFHRTSMHVSPILQNVGASDSSTSDGYAKDIDVEANSYFHNIFSGQLPIESIIQMLARFKESSEKREQTIYECMIQNLFEECRFFPRYPEKQLKIVAVLIGSLIKHQLVTHLTLGIALRSVLDALRKPTDSKLFAFGTKALEQFLDRLVEWPQYCNHILQISHLRSTHPELVAFIERVLARISSSHLELNGNSTSTDPHSGSTLVTLENMEVSDSSWQSLGSRTTQPGQQLSSPFQMQHRHQGFLGDRHKTSATSISYTKPLLPPSGHPLNVSVSDTANTQKLNVPQSLQPVSSQNPTSVPATGSSSTGFLHSSRAITSTSMLRQTGFGSALNIETLVAAAERRDTPIEAPASDIQDKILFMINNISSSNIEAKAKEFTEILNEQYYPWFAQYMVMKRASIEPNFHDLYLKFLDKVNSKPLNKEIVKAAYENCKVLLRSELIKSSSEERSLLKNLGSWLGKFTIGRNQVLRAREIDPKSLIIEAYEKGLMIAVIPFTSKILEPCQSSLAYRPPNPWTMAILGLLAEIYALPNLKMNLKFDIEVLFKNLAVDMKEVKPTSLLKDRVREVEGNPDFSNKDIGASQPQMVAEINSGMLSTLNQVELQPEIVNSSHPGGHLNVLSQYPAGLHLTPGPLMEDEKMANLSLPDRIPSGQGLSQVAPSQSPYSVGQLPAPIPNIGSHIIFNQKLSALGLHYFQRVVPIAMERAIKEVMSPVVQRSVAIAIQTTKELVLKDYAMESDETRIYNAAHLMVASLAGSLAHVTCKEPLRASISSQLRNSFQGLNIANELLEQAVPLVMNDNLDLGCAVIEHAATEKALQTIDGEIAQQLSLRRKHREGVGPSYYDASMYTQGPMGVIPEALRPRPGHLSHSQQRVYEDFVRFPWQNQSGQSSNAMPAGPPASSSGSVSSGLSRPYVSTPGQMNPGFYSSSLGATGLSAVTQPLDLISEDMDPSSAQLLSGPSPRIGAVDGVTPHGVILNSAASFPSTAAAHEVHLVEGPNAVKELGATAVSLPTTSTTEHLGSSISEPLFNTKDALEKYQIVAQKLETLISKDTGEAEIQGVIAQIPEILLKCISRDEAALAVAQKVFKSLYENASNSLHVGAHLAILAAIRDVCKLVVKEVTSWVIYSDEERKFNTDIIVGLIRKDLLNLAEYNMHMAKLIDAGRNKAATEFAISLLQTLLVQESRVSVSELPNLVDVLAKLATRPGSPDSLQQLVEIARNPAANAAVLSGFTVGKEDRAKQSREKKASDRSTASREDYINTESVGVDPAGFREQVSVLFAEWYQIYELHGTNDTACTQFISKLQQNGLLDGDDMSDRFFRLLMELAVAHCLSSEVISSRSLSLQSPQPPLNLSFLAIDVYLKLVVLILKYCTMEHGQNKFFLLPKILTITVRVIQRDVEEKRTSFNPRPYFRLLINWLFDLISPDPVLDGPNFQFQVLITFANAFLSLQPLKSPAFRSFYTGIGIHQLLDDGTLGPEKEVHGFPDGAKINFVSWSYDGRHLSFSIRVDEEDDSSSKLRVWVADVETGNARPLFQSPDIVLNAVFDNFVWVDDSTLLVCTIPLSRGGPPKKPVVPFGPKIQSNEQKNIIQVRTFQDLLKDEYDEDLFDYYATTQLVLASLDGTVKEIGPPAVYTSMDPSPDEKYVLISSIHRPYSFIVPCGRFPKKVDVWTADGKFVREFCDLPLAEDIPIAFNSVRKGMRSINWRADKPSTLYWVETQDGGDAKVEVSPRDIIYTQPAEPLEGEETSVLHKLDLRYGGISWCDDSLALVYESWYKTRRTRTWVISPGSEDVSPRILFDRSSEDVYSDPGSPMLRRTPAGTYVIAKIKKENDEGSYILLNGSGATPEGNIPFLDLFDINTGSKERIWQSDKEKYYETVIALMSDKNEGDIDINQLRILTSKESKTENTQYYIQSWPDRKACQITNFPHPYPQLATLQKEMIRYQRKDGVQLTATLYLPPGYDPSKDGPLPCLVWSYPGEFKSKDAAGQVRGSPNEFPGIGPTSALLWLARRFAILSGPTIPIIGEGDEEANDRYVEQLVASAEAAVEEVIRRGVAHPNKIAVGGHSYGAFMTANLLAHAPHLFCCGIARSGAYNRTLTPFGFQNEDRTLWEATSVYVEMSPFMSANKIKKPILLIHGEEDNNSGTLTMQSDRFFNALKGHGALCRLVILPFESHGYAARESIMHVLWETDRWLQSYCVSNTSDVNADLDASKDNTSKEITDPVGKAVTASGGGGSSELADLEHERFHSMPRSSL